MLGINLKRVDSPIGLGVDWRCAQEMIRLMQTKLIQLLRATANETAAIDFYFDIWLARTKRISNDSEFRNVPLLECV